MWTQLIIAHTLSLKLISFACSNYQRLQKPFADFQKLLKTPRNDPTGNTKHTDQITHKVASFTTVFKMALK